MNNHSITSINDGIRVYLPDLPGYTQSVTVADLLHHTSGIRNNTVLAYFMIEQPERKACRK